ncbi:MAG: Crossover junction endodeoxyribonuclease RuvC [Holosporales bacterium]
MREIILGIDPGLQKAGYGIIEKNQNALKAIACGVIKPDTSLDLSLRLAHLHEELLSILKCHQPTVVAIEETFVNKNPTSTLKLGMARGVLMMTPSLLKIPVFEYSANKVKKAVVGVGHAEKEQVMTMMRHFFPTLSKVLTSDSADALAIAVCHANHSPFFNKFV